MKMVSMKIEKKPEYDKDKTMLCCEPEGGGPVYPYGLTVCLDDESLQKLGINSLPNVGGQMMLHAMVTVTSNSQRQNQDGKTSSMDLQITDMALMTGAEKTSEQGLYSESNMNQ